MTANRGTERLEQDLARQRSGLGERVPSYGRLFSELEAILSASDPQARWLREALDRIWARRTFLVYYERPLLLAAALRADALSQGTAHPLWRALAAPTPDPGAVEPAAVREALDPSRVDLWTALEHRRVQTNETSRAVAWVWPAWLAGCDGGARPLALVDVGASAGLNLVADRLPGIWRDVAGATVPVATHIDAEARIGLDAEPLDIRDEASVRWMRACIWVGEAERLERFEQAVAALKATPSVELQRADIVEAPARLAALAARVRPGGLVLAYQSIVRDYIDPSAREAYEAGMRSWLAGEAPGRALWVTLEIAVTPDPELPASITAHPSGAGGRALELARCGYHPRELRVSTEAVQALRRGG